MDNSKAFLEESRRVANEDLRHALSALDKNPTHEAFHSEWKCTVRKLLDEIDLYTRLIEFIDSNEVQS